MDIWPKPRLTFRVRNLLKKTSDIEKILYKNFSGGHPVIISSGRAAIHLLVNEFWLENSIYVFDYASQCVVNAIIQTGKIPTTGITHLGSDIIYNQWGYKFDASSKSGFITDAVDSFYPLNSKVLISGTRFEVWSFSKILGSFSGAVIWCKTESDAIYLRKKINSSRKSFIIFYKFSLRFLSRYFTLAHFYWEKLEFKNGSLSRLEIASLYANIKDWNKKYISRKTIYNKIKSSLELSIYAELQVGILPSVFVSDENYIKQSHKVLHKIMPHSKPKKVLVIPLN